VKESKGGLARGEDLSGCGDSHCLSGASKLPALVRQESNQIPGAGHGFRRAANCRPAGKSIVRCSISRYCSGVRNVESWELIFVRQSAS
jgi:hypothetical protein